MGNKFKLNAVTWAIVLAVMVTTASPLFAALSDTKIEYSWKRLASGTTTPQFRASGIAGAPLISSQNAGNDVATGIASDANSRVFSVGFTNSIRFGTVSSNIAGSNDVWYARYGTTTPASGGSSDGGGLTLADVDDTTLKTIVGEGEPFSFTLGTTGDDRGMGIAVDKNGTSSVYITGFTSGSLDSDGDADFTNSNAGDYDLFLTKVTAATGSVPWTRLIGGTGDDRGYAVAVDSGVDKNVYAVGESNSAAFGTYGDGGTVSNSASGGYDVLVVKWKGDGDVAATTPAQIWTRFLGSAGFDSARGVAVDVNENVYIAGVTNGAYEGLTALGGKDIFVQEIDLNGFDGSWKIIQGTAGDDEATGIVITEDSDEGDFVYVSGSTDGSLNSQTSYGKKDAFVMKIKRSDGTVQWTELVGSTENDRGTGLTVDTNTNKVYLVGTTEGAMDKDGVNSGTDKHSATGSTDAFVAQLDIVTGNWERTQVLATAQRDIANGVAVKPKSTMLFVAGTTDGTPSINFPNTRSGGLDAFDWKLSALEDIAVSSDGDLRFANQELNVTGTRTVTVTNLTSTAITMGTIVASAPFSVDIVNGSQVPGWAACTEGLSVAASGGTCTALLKFSPTSGGVFIDNIVFNITGTNTPTSLDLQVKGKGIGVTAAATDRATITSPDPNDATVDICGNVTEFKWQASSSGTDDQYWLYVGTKPGGRDIYSATQNTDTKVSVSIPSATNIYVTLWTRQGTVWRSKQYTYACSSGPSASNVKATLTDPTTVPTANVTDGTAKQALTSSTTTFKWSDGTNVSEYWLYVGTTVGGSEIFTSSKATVSKQATVLSIPTGGASANAYTRIWSHFNNGSWEFNDYHYTQPTS